MKKLLSLFALGACTIPAFAQWNTNTLVNIEVSTRTVSDMKAANTADGKTWVAYYSPRPSTNQYDMYAQLLDTAGNKLLGPDGVAVDTNISGSATFVFNAGVDDKGNLIIGMQDARSGTNATVAYKVNQSGVSLWNGAAGVVLGPGLSPNLVELASGDILFTWGGNDNKINMQKLNATGTGAWATPKVFSYGAKSSRGQMTAMSDSGFVMVYQVYNFGVNSKIYAQRFNSNGDSVWTSSKLLCGTETTSIARYYSIAQEADTTYFGYYSSAATNHFNAWVQRINPDGTLPYAGNGAAVSDFSTGADPHEQMTNIALQPNSPYVWAVTSYNVTVPQVQWGIITQKFDKATGQPQFNANGKVVYPLTATEQYAQQGGVTFKRQFPVFMVVSGTSFVIKGTVLNADGDFLLPAQDFELSGTAITQPSALTKSRFSFTNMINSQSVAVWKENRGTELGYAQNFRLDILDTSVHVVTVNNVPAAINTFQGTLAMTANVLPATANQDVTWSVVPGTGTATISNTGVITAVSNGTVWAKATSNIASIYADSLQITISNQGVGISELERNIGFKMYPNPANDILNLQIKEKHTDLVIQLIDVSGKVVMTKKVMANTLNEPYAFSLKHLSSGTYILQVKGEGLDLNKKFTRQ
jgi:hypothetical protein